MESTPTPYQRNRRAGRMEALPPEESFPVSAAPVETALQQTQAPQSPAYTEQAYAPGLTPTHQRPIPQPRAAQAEPLRRFGQQAASEPLPRPRMASTPAVRQAQPGPRPQAGGNPRAIQKAYPEAFPKAEPQPRRSETPAKKPVKQATKPEEKKPAKSRKTPSWLTTLMCLMMVGVMALVAGISLMQAFLKTAADQKQAAYEAILYNYHITEQSDGTLTVTWQDLIERYAAQYNLDPAFVTAIIRNESSFRTDAVSSVGARGLMQMMPATAEWIAGKLDEPYDFDRIFDAETSIRYGCWYLNYLSELFAGDPVLVCAAYHAGQGEVLSWLGDEDISIDGVHVLIGDIPISNTRTYAGRVTQAYGIYETLLYPQ